MTGTLVTDSHPDDVISAEEGQRAYSSLSLAAGHALGWTHGATLRKAGGVSEVVVWRAQFGFGRVIVSVLPFEWIGRTAMVEKALTRATRNRGILILGSKSAPPWYRDVEPGQVLVRQPDPAAGGALLRSFSHLRLCEDVDWSTQAELTRSTLLARLENSGTVEFLAQGPGGAVFARLDGVPRYLQRLRDAQTQLLTWISDLPSSPTFHLLALALLSDACEQVVRGELYIPDLFRKETVAAVVTSAMSRRVSNGSVDGLLLPTVNLLAACSICDIDDSAAVTMAAWIAMYAGDATADQRAQARWVLRAAGRADLLGLVPEPATRPDSMFGQLGCQLDDCILVAPDLVAAGAADVAAAGVGPLSDLDCALLAYTHARWGKAADAEPIWQVLASARHKHLGPTEARVNNVEELCYRTAAEDPARRPHAADHPSQTATACGGDGAAKHDRAVDPAEPPLRSRPTRSDKPARCSRRSASPRASWPAASGSSPSWSARASRRCRCGSPRLASWGQTSASAWPWAPSWSCPRS